MKKILFSLLAVLICLSVISQEDVKTDDKKEKVKSDEIQTLFGGDKVSHGGFGTIESDFGTLMGDPAIFVGMRGGWIINHWLSFGVGGYGLVTNLHKDDIINTTTIQFEMGYGGFAFEPTLLSKFPIHISFPMLFGMGYGVFRDELYFYDDYLNDWEKHRVDDDVFMIFEPGVSIELNVVKFFRLGFTAKYKYMSDVDLIKTVDKDLNGWSTGLTLKFGKF